MGQSKQRGTFEERRARAIEAKGSMGNLPPHASMLDVPFRVSQGYLDKQQIVQLLARNEKRYRDEAAIYLQVLLAFSKPLDLNFDLCERFKSKVGGMLWMFYGDFLDCTAITVFDLEGIPHVILNAEAHRGDEASQIHELIDSLAHEMAHATGPLLGRWNIDLQPNLSNIDEGNVLEYAIEEFIAITAALKLYGAQIGLSPEKSEQLRSSSIETVIEQLQLTPDMQAKVVWPHIESCSQVIVDFLNSPSMA